MILKLVQTNKDLYAAQFIISRAAKEVGAASLCGRPTSMEAVICGKFNGTDFEMMHGRNIFTGKKAFRPYLVKQDNVETGAVYQTKYNGGLFKKYEFHQMVKEGRTYDLFSIGCGKEGSKCMLYCSSSQIAQIEKQCVVYNELHNFDIFAADENAALISVLFCFYMYVNAFYTPGEKVTVSKTKTISVTTNKLLKEKYNPHFKDYIAE